MHRYWLFAAAGLVTVCILAIAVRLAMAWSAAGSGYPPFSSLRADAQGLKAMFDVAEVLRRDAIRSYLPASELQVKGATILKLGLSVEALSLAALPGRDNAATLAAAGNTVVLGVTGDCRRQTIKQWQLTLSCDDEGQYLAGSGWRALQSNKFGHAHVVERKFGGGELLLIANSRLLNNGALARHPNPMLIGMVLERRPTILFDEEHLGVTDSLSVGSLLRHYRLHGVMLAALLLFSLFVWKNTTSFLPRVEIAQDEIAGRDTTAGLANLLRRSVPEADLLTTAIAEWAKPLKDKEREREVRALAATHKNPVEGYNAVAAAVHQKRIKA